MKWLPDSEIIDLYTAAEDKRKAVDELAARCRTDRTGMRAKLSELGLDVTQPPPLGEYKRNRLDGEKALAMYNEGMSDVEIGRKLGVSSVAVFNWRRKNGLEANHEPIGKKQKKPSQSLRDSSPRGGAKGDDGAQRELLEETTGSPKETDAQEIDRRLEALSAERELQESDVDPENLYAARLSTLLGNLNAEFGRGVAVYAAGAPVRSAVVTLRYDLLRDKPEVRVELA